MSRFILCVILYAGLQIAANAHDEADAPRTILQESNGYVYNADVDAWVRLYSVPDNWLNARKRCHQDGAHLVFPSNTELGNAYKKLMMEKEVTSDVFTADLSYRSDAFMCKSMSLAGVLNDVKCGEKLPYICQKEEKHQCKTNGYGYVAATGKCYKFHGAARNWRSALRRCHSEGGHLAIIESNSESSILRDIFERKSDTITGETNKQYAIVGFRKYADGGWATLYGGVWSLRNLSISVPRAVLSGEGQAAVLRCSYDLEGAALYSIRWYRAETEFYRYVPRELPPTMVFPLPGASVDLTQSDEHQVRIVNLNRRLSGDYQCEVSADAPLFHTDIRSAPLTVVDPPFRAPRISVSRGNYARGDVIKASCTVDEAYPAPNITWILDEHKIAETVADPVSELDFTERGASSQLEITVVETEQYRVGLTYTSNSLARAYHHEEPSKNHSVVRYTLVPPPSGQFELGCVSTILDIYARQSERVTVREDAPRPASVTGEDSAGATAALSFTLAGCACAFHLL